MTGNQIHTLLLQNLQQLGGFGTKGFTANERTLILDLAVDRFIKQRFTGSLTGKGLEEGSKRTADLSNLLTITKGLVKETNPSSITSISNAAIFTLPGATLGGRYILDFYFYIWSQSQVTREGAGTSVWIPNDIVTHKDLGKYIKSDINDPIIRKPLILFTGIKAFILHQDGDTIEDLELVYLKKPASVVADADEYISLPPHTHYEIAEIATAIAKERSERSSYPTSQNELKQVE